jgi:hypothetical protein
MLQSNNGFLYQTGFDEISFRTVCARSPVRTNNLSKANFLAGGFGRLALPTAYF